MKKIIIILIATVLALSSCNTLDETKHIQKNNEKYEIITTLNYYKDGRQVQITTIKGINIDNAIKHPNIDYDSVTKDIQVVKKYRASIKEDKR
ncbi:membrane lipoprotein lipid attachment site-containing protein [Aquimarina sp. AU58]|uniref:membrane lipoprotein lipid attachment site-containing protein n=1 Tax=Aquimarina sp. AU58 TaxID=1874112 RepID=UPI000D6DE6CC|nr:membrane lipoprotein lipid attachment site-containing protein [Aquimarina sp. AU58]